MNFEEFKIKQIENLNSAKNPQEFVATCEFMKFEIIMNFLNVEELFKGK